MSYGKNEKPTVSIIMGAYNIEHTKTFICAINSILKQSFSNFELIICDDGSTDSTWNIITSYAKKDRRIRLLKNDKNLGLAATLNRCIDVSNADLIARHDADDFSDLNRLEKQIYFLNTHPEIMFVGSNVSLFDEAGIYANRIFPEFPSKKDFMFTMPFVHGALLFRKSALLKADKYRVSNETRRAEDYDLLMRMYSLNLCGANLQENLYFFLEDHAALARRKYKYRLDEAVVRWKGFQSLGLMPIALPYVIKPLIVGLIPIKVLSKLKSHRSERMITH